MNQTYKATLLQYALLPTRPSWGDLEGWSRETMFEKYPSISPYTYCANNPMKYVDPTGKFPFPMHAAMVDKALSKTIISFDARNSVGYGASVVADITYGKVHSVHLDNMSGFSSIAKAYNRAKSNFRSNINSRNFQNAGVNLHTVADFYAHSNYIELYKDYAKANGEKLDVNTIPTFSEAMQDPKLSQYLKDHNLKTGTSNNSGPLLISYVKSLFNEDKGSHNKMNLDDNNSYKGSQEFSGNITLHDAAIVVAQKDLDQTVQQ